MRLKRFEQMNEGLTDDYPLHTEITDVDIRKENLSDIEDIDWIDTKKCVVYWDYELNVSSSGIEYILPRIGKIILDVTVYTVDEDEKEEDFDKTFEYDILNSDIDTTDEDGNQTIPYLPKEVYISHLETSDDNKSKIEVVF